MPRISNSTHWMCCDYEKNTSLQMETIRNWSKIIESYHFFTRRSVLRRKCGKSWKLLDFSIQLMKVIRYCRFFDAEN